MASVASCSSLKVNVRQPASVGLPPSRSDSFSIAAFKGQKLTFRNWNWQLRQPILIGDADSVVSTSPQEGFLHQVSELDTLGVDRPETKCKLN